MDGQRETPREPPPIAVTLGDPRGIGPEVMPCAVRSLLEEWPTAPIRMLGPEGHDPALTPFFPVGSWDGTEAGAGKVTVAAIEAAIRMAREGAIGALVTGPSHKPAIRAAGWNVPGQTELLKALTGSEEVGMLMCAEETEPGPPLRVLLATTHIPLREVFRHLDPTLLVRQTTLLADSLARDWRIAAPRIGLCAVNPHAGDGGLFGDEEETLYEPALEELRSRGIDARGPFPADTIFHRALQGDLDAVVAPYHDVGMAAFKSVAFGKGVNVTLGLPLIRTSPDHGTAFDIVGTGKADPGSALAALRLAGRLLQNRFDTPEGQG